MNSLTIRSLWKATLAALLVVISWHQAIATEDVPLKRFEFTQVQMGMDFKVTFYATDQAVANRAADEAYARIRELNACLSDYDPDSELSRLSKTAGSGRAISVSTDLWHVLAASQRLAAETAGAFDVTVGPMVRLWRRARRERELPTAERLAMARQAVGHRFIELDDVKRTATLTQPGMRLDLGGIAAGFAADEALAVLAEHGIGRALVDASGDIVAGDPPPDEPGWKIGIAPQGEAGRPSRYVWLANRAISTSGDAYQFVEIGGIRYSHIVDSQTGLGLTASRAVVVVAPKCMMADSLATALCVLGAGRGLALIEKRQDVAALFVERPGDNDESATDKHENWHTRISPDFDKLVPTLTGR
ncbi:MAG: FAD:protein FMN transferase [Pirellulales bacterium]|nr:FAD:protein FMN transferase [Pirellulales bacterium]